ncbi:RNA polymerase sigma factor [Streptomyces sp. NPDC048415]|uniref:RNA polymerase sigma factor n=1 Tax=Streptomyces sp. NPDC048415 TaxID=3154822 RepID=UPI0034315EAE
MPDLETTDVTDAPETTPSPNIEALAALYRKDGPRMTALVARLLRERDVPEAAVGAEDLVHTAFEKALRVHRVLTEPRAYIYTTLRRDVTHWAVRLQREREREAERLAELRTSPAHGRDVGALVADRVIVRDAVRQLSTQQATAVVAAKMYGFTQHETAQLTGRHPGTVAVNIARAVVSLALTLTPVLLILLAIRLYNGWSPFLIAGALILGSRATSSVICCHTPISLFLPGPIDPGEAVKLLRGVQRVRAKLGAGR